MSGPRICEECKKPMMPFVSHTRLKSSEFHCIPCKISYIMDKPGEAEHWASVIKQGLA